PVQGGVARLATAIEEARDEADNVLLLDAGDQFQGTLYFTVGGANVVADVMNELAYDAMCIGNHEFDSGPAELARFIDLAEFPVLSANTDALADADLADEILPYELFDYGRETVAVIGLTSEYTSISSSPGLNVRFLDVISTAQRTAQELEEAGINKIIALTHLGYDRDLELATSVHGIDVIVGGHSHTNVEHYPTVTSSISGEPVLIVTAYEWGKQLGRLNVVFTADGLVGSFYGEPIVIDESISEDDDMLELLAEYRPAIDALMTTIVGATDVALNGAREDIRVRETNLGNLICDAMLWKTQDFDATLSIQNGGGIRASIPKGMITMGQVLEVLPYGNQITVLRLSGEDIWAALENGVSQVEESSGRFPHVGGMRYTFDPAADAGSRVTSVEVWDTVTEMYVPIDLEARYQLATNNFIANSGDGYSMLAESTDRYDSGWLLSDTLAEYLDAHAPVEPVVEGRIIESSAENPE
ncbi:5'-nucleotidase C-terminal domain-containing protein, partial [Candidatus Bipolaricaulota bacterium]|nr:5'-nucleotidase C-terminal domain-containing protein [Candidatus Bipolaricaulota bacterium]